MTHQTMILLIVCSALLIVLTGLIKNRPQYLILLGIRGLFSFFFFRIINKMCLTAGVPVIIGTNPVSIAAGSILGFPGLLLLYLSKICFF